MSQRTRTVVTVLRLSLCLGFSAALMVGGACVEAADDATWLCRLKLVSEAEPDMTSVESILKDITRPDMTDELKCIAVYQFVHQHRFWYPSAAAMQNGRAVSDPVLQANCYATLICQQDAAITGALWAGLGYDVRYWQLKGHTTGEVYYGGRWRNFDATLGRYRRDKDGEIGDVSLTQGSMYKPGVSYIPPYDDYEVGHRMDLSLRRGETFTRYWYPLSKENDYFRPGGSAGRFPDDKKGQRRDLASIMRKKPYRIDAKGAGYCNGLWEFKPDLSDDRWREGFESTENVAVAGGKCLSTKAAGTPAELVWRMRTPYIITGAWVEGEFTTDGAADAVKLSVSTNNGATWQETDAVKAGRQKLVLREHVADKFSYLLKLVMKGAPGAVGVRDLSCTTVVQTNPLSLPALQAGPNKIRLSLGEQVETMTIYPDLETSDYRAQVLEESNIVTAREQLQEKWLRGLCAGVGGRDSTLVYKVTAPGDIRQVRWGGRFRASKDDLNEMHYSTDGKTWKPQPMSNRWTFPTSETPNLYIAYNETTKDLPEGTRTVFLKYRFKRPVPKKDPAELHIANAIRIDVDYVPKAKTGTAPVEVTYCWAEGDEKNPVEKTHTELARPDKSGPHTYTLTVAGEEKPLMKWVRLRVAAP